LIILNLVNFKGIDGVDASAGIRSWFEKAALFLATQHLVGVSKKKLPEKDKRGMGAVRNRNMQVGFR
jgi:hypothetical protein